MRIVQHLLKLFFCTFLCLQPIAAQTVAWELKPADYSDISHINRNLFKATKGGSIFLVEPNGSIIAQGSALGLFYEDKALLTTADSKGERIVGCLETNGTFHPFKNKYYTLNGQKFYSDNVLTVEDENKRKGYIDVQGNAVLGFNGKYSNIKPFTEGYAVMFEGSGKTRKYHLVDKEGNAVQFRFQGVGEVYRGVNVYNGEAYIWDTYNTFYIYNTRTGGYCKKTKKPKSMERDYLYCFSAITGRSTDVPFGEFAYHGEGGLQPTAKEGLYGYTTSQGATVIPAQFTAATAFEDNLAIVHHNGKIGILRYIPVGSFKASAVNKTHRFYAGDRINCSFSIEVPEVWRQEKLNITFKDEAGNLVKITGKDNSYSFVATPTSTTRSKYHIAIEGDGIHLFEGTLTYSFERRYRCATCHKDKEECEYKGNHPVIKPEEPKTNTTPVRNDNKKKDDKNKKEERCKDCGKPISECEYGGWH